MREAFVISTEQRNLLKGETFNNSVNFSPIPNSKGQYIISKEEKESNIYPWFADLVEEDYEELPIGEGAVIDLTNQNLDSGGLNERLENLGEYLPDNIPSRMILAGVTNEAPDSISGGINGLAAVEKILNKGIVTITKVGEPINNPDIEEVTDTVPFLACGWTLGTNKIDMIVPEENPIQANEVARGNKNIRGGFKALTQEEMIEEIVNRGLELPT